MGRTKDYKGQKVLSVQDNSLTHLALNTYALGEVGSNYRMHAVAGLLVFIRVREQASFGLLEVGLAHNPSREPSRHTIDR